MYQRVEAIAAIKVSKDPVALDEYCSAKSFGRYFRISLCSPLATVDLGSPTISLSSPHSLQNMLQIRHDLHL